MESMSLVSEEKVEANNMMATDSFSKDKAEDKTMVKAEV